jgi:hypothetical protein
MKILGTHLSSKLQDEAKRRFVHRFTGEHRPMWANKPFKQEGGTVGPYPVQFKDDADWLAHTYFEITKQGKFSERAHYCESHPTWPDNPEFRR